MSEKTYDFDALGTLQWIGVKSLSFCCVNRACTNKVDVPISTLINQCGPETSLVTVARRIVCQKCNAIGGHVQPSRPWSGRTGGAAPFAWGSPDGLEFTGKPQPLRLASHEEVEGALIFALRFSGRKRIHTGDELMAGIVADRLIEELERSGFVLLKKPPNAPSGT